MGIAENLLYIEIGKHVMKNMADVNGERYCKLAENRAVVILKKIKDVICDEEAEDFMKIDKIVDIFEEYNIDTGSCHDFG